METRKKILRAEFQIHLAEAAADRGGDELNLTLGIEDTYSRS